MSEQMKYVAHIGIDWADEEHAVHVIADGASRSYSVEQTPEAIAAWVEELRQTFGAGKIAVCLEQSRGALTTVLVQYDNLDLYPINPKQLAKFREAMYPSGAKDDPEDAELAALMLTQNMERLRLFNPTDALTRQIASATEKRRHLVNQKTKISQRLRQLLKEYFPQAVMLFGKKMACPMVYDFLIKWPSLQQAKRSGRDYLERFFRLHNCRSSARIAERVEIIHNSKPLTDDPAVIEPAILMAQAEVHQLRALDKAIEKFDEMINSLMQQSPKSSVYRSLPGAGQALAPRLLAAVESCGLNAVQMQNYSGIAPITQKSGKSKIVRRRFGRPKFLHQSFHEFARQSIAFCDWARAYFIAQRNKGKKANSVYRALAYKWIRIIVRLAETGEEYDNQKYVQTLKQRKSPIAELLKDS